MLVVFRIQPERTKVMAYTSDVAEIAADLGWVRVWEPGESPGDMGDWKWRCPHHGQRTQRLPLSVSG